MKTATKIKPATKAEKVAKPEAKPAKNASSPKAKKSDLKDQVLAQLTPKAQTTREIVLALGRECGQAQGGPVLTQLHNLVKEGLAVATKNEGYPGHCWALAKGKAKVSA